MDKEWTRDEFIRALKDGECNVTYTKKNGECRLVHCTLKEEVVRPFIEAIEARKKKLLAEGKDIVSKPENLNAVSVIDMDAKGWRTLLLDGIEQITLTGNIKW